MATQAPEQLAVRVCDGTISAARKRTSSVGAGMWDCAVVVSMFRRDRAAIGRVAFEGSNHKIRASHSHASQIVLYRRVFRFSLTLTL